MNLLHSVMIHNLTGQAARKTIVVDGTEASISPAAGRIYRCGVLTSLSLTNLPASGLYCISFDSGDQPTTTVFPTSLSGLERFAAKANQHYEIVVLDGYASVNHWAVQK